MSVPFLRERNTDSMTKSTDARSLVCIKCVTDPHLWARGFFGLLGDEDPHPHQGPSFGGGIDVPMEPVHAVGAFGALPAVSVSNPTSAAVRSR